MANERLRAALLAKGMSVAVLAEAIAVDPKTVERWITKGREPYRKHRFAVASLLGTDETYLWPQALSQEQVVAASESEIINVYPHRWTMPRGAWEGLFRGASEKIDILVYVGMFLAEDAGLIRLLAERGRSGARLRVLLGDPESEEVIRRSADEGIGKDAISAKIRSVLSLYAPLREVAEFRMHGTTLYNSIFRADDQVLVNTHVYGEVASNAPVLHLRRVAGGDMVTTYLDSFDKIWNEARPVEW
ncbi:XRE family transcriptional regulator [Streptosporangium sp. NPDC023615]|uniref:XRE family transcriptional regulator n=1 Tax=unclassified Streptosporangium TaxID=2632669 RepID=UPI003438419E